MLQSMTGFGQSALTSELGEITIEIKSLNSKNFDINFNIHSHLKDLEKELRSLFELTIIDFISYGTHFAPCINSPPKPS